MLNARRTIRQRADLFVLPSNLILKRSKLAKSVAIHDNFNKKVLSLTKSQRYAPFTGADLGGGLGFDRLC